MVVENVFRLILLKLTLLAGSITVSPVVHDLIRLGLVLGLTEYLLLSQRRFRN